jgi:hypothetical protein
MSFDLVVWYEPWPISGEEARHKLDLAYDDGDESGFIPHEAVRRFRRDLLAQFPAQENLDLGDDSAVWSVTPNDSDRYVSMCMRYSKADDVIPVIRELASIHGLILLDPQDNSVYLPPSLGRTLELTVAGKRKLVDPEPDVLAYQVRRALEQGSFAIVEAEPGYYMQAGSGPAAGTSLAGYAVEYRDGSVEAHFRYETLNLDDVLAVFEAFRANDGAFRTRLPWKPYL